MRRVGIAFIVIAIIVFLFNKQASAPRPPIPPDNEEEQVVDFEKWFQHHQLECDICEPGWPPRLCTEAWNKLNAQRLHQKEIENE
jgi:hypothetical protein